jgi:prolyl oligopeptidase
MIKWFLLAAVIICSAHFSYAQLVYPDTKKVDQADDYHGTIVHDPYRWLENDTSDETKNWVTQQNAITFKYLEAIPFRDSVKKRLLDLFSYERFGIPFHNNGYYYFFKNDGLQNQPVVYRQKGFNGTTEMIIDPNKFSADATTQLGDFEVSKDGKYAAYSISRAGSDWHTIFVKDMKTLTDLPDSVSWVKASTIQWRKNGFYYSRYPTPEKGTELSSANEYHQVWYHTTGTSQDKDKLIYEDKQNPQRFHTAYVSEDERYVILVVSDRGKGLRGNALFYMDTKSGNNTFKPIVKDITNFEYSPVGMVNNKFIVYTNANAQNNKILQFDPAAKKGSEWKTIVPESKENLQNASIVGGKLFLQYLIDVTSKVYVYTTDGKKEKEVMLPGPGNAAGFGGENADKYTFYSFNTFNVPTQIYRYEVASGKSELYRNPNTAVDPSQFETQQQFY